MTSGKCIVCETPFTRGNDSREHVLPNAIGGRLKITGFICRNCNSNAGQTWDAELAAQLQPLSLLFSITRERGEPPGMDVNTTAGEKLHMKSDGSLTRAKPNFNARQTERGLEVSLTARSTTEARKMLQGLKRRHPALDIEKLLAGADPEPEFPKGMIHLQLQLGGKVSGRSIVKSALAFAHSVGVSITDGDAVTYLRDAAAEPPFGYYYETELVAQRPTAVPFHCVAVSANPETGLALGYVEYFGIHRVIVCLTRTYAGPAVTRSYAIDPRSGQTLELAVDIALSADDLPRIYDYQTVPHEAVIDAYHAVIPEALRQNFERSRDRALEEAIAYAFKTCGAQEGDILTEEHLNKISDTVVQRMIPFILPRRTIQGPHDALTSDDEYN